MSSIKKNIAGKKVKVKSGAKIAIVQSTYNKEITDVLFKSCLEELKKGGVREKNIHHLRVPGAWEIPFACQQAAKKRPDAIIAIGAIIKGETPHFDFIAKQVSGAIMNLSLKLDIPIIFGVLTILNLTQAKARIKGGRRGDKGLEAALCSECTQLDFDQIGWCDPPEGRRTRPTWRPREGFGIPYAFPCSGR